jgi:hypothetical protein
MGCIPDIAHGLRHDEIIANGGGVGQISNVMEVSNLSVEALKLSHYSKLLSLFGGVDLAPHNLSATKSLSSVQHGLGMTSWLTKVMVQFQLI